MKKEWRTQVMSINNKFKDEVNTWSNRFYDLMKRYWNAAAAIVTYYISDDSEIDACPLGDTEFECLGKELRTNSAAFIAAEETGMVVAGVGAIFYSALDNCGSWSHNSSIIKDILNDDNLSKYVAFNDKYLAKALLSGGQLVCEDDDLWLQFYKYAAEKLEDREERGF